jgi:hypothetical protein
MLLGEFEHAWRESDLADAWFPRPVPATFGRLVIRCLRGLGDAIQFLRFLPLLRPRCARVEVEAPHGLLPLLHCMRGIDEAVAMGLAAPMHPGDVQAECSDLPYMLRATLDTLPPPMRIEVPRRISLSETGSLRVGLVWASGDWNDSRSISPKLFQLFRRVPRVDLYSLQRSPHGPQLLPPILPWLRSLEPVEPDILATAAAILELDLVISVDTMVAHLAASLGKPVWLLLTPQSDWRWMLDRSDSPWYPSMRLFRQKTVHGVSHLLGEVVSALTALTSAGDKSAMKC